MKNFLILTAAALAFATPATAGNPVTLRMDTTDADGRITLGDLFDGVSGPAANLMVGQRLGPTAVLDAGQVQVMAHRAGFDWNNANGVRRIIVRPPERLFCSPDGFFPPPPCLASLLPRRCIMYQNM